MHVLALVDDLMFGSRIHEAARASGADVVWVREPEAALERARAERPALVLIDLDRDRLRPLETIRLLHQEPALADVPMLAFVSHVHQQRSREAEAAGCSRVLARGAFVRSLPELLDSALLAARANS